MEQDYLLKNFRRFELKKEKHYHLYLFVKLFQINKGSSQIRAAIPYLANQIKEKVSLALIYPGLPLFD